MKIDNILSLLFPGISLGQQQAATPKHSQICNNLKVTANRISLPKALRRNVV
jgi:hypothetical protein